MTKRSKATGGQSQSVIHGQPMSTIDEQPDSRGIIYDRKKQDAEDEQWAQRLEALSAKLRRINPLFMVQEPGMGLTQICPTMYPDPKFRVDVEAYIVQLDPAGTIFLPRKPQAYDFRSQRMRETIEKAETLMQKFIQEHPFCKQHLLG
jgi:hypothetical protein